MGSRGNLNQLSKEAFRSRLLLVQGKRMDLIDRATPAEESVEIVN